MHKLGGNSTTYFVAKDTDGAAVTPMKRGREGDGVSQHPSKIAKIEMNFVSCTELAGHVLASVPMVSIRATKAPTLSFRIGNKLAIMNESAQDIKWNAGTLVCAFGRGKFVSKTDEKAVDPNKELLFGLENSDSKIIFGGALTTVGEVLKQKQVNLPTACVNYHDLTCTEGGKFNLARKHLVAFVPNAKQAVEEEEDAEGGNTTSLQASAGSLVLPTVWDTKYTMRLWSCVWKARGLMPMRPQVVFSCDGVLPPWKALEICS